MSVVSIHSLYHPRSDEKKKPKRLYRHTNPGGYKKRTDGMTRKRRRRKKRKNLSMKTASKKEEENVKGYDLLRLSSVGVFLFLQRKKLRWQGEK
jgi:hypothetical protein